MQYLQKSFSVTMPGSCPAACEACVFGSGPHTCREYSHVTVRSDKLEPLEQVGFEILRENQKRARSERF